MIKAKEFEGRGTCEEKCDTAFIIDLLHLLTLRKPVTVERESRRHAVSDSRSRESFVLRQTTREALTLTETPCLSPKMPYWRRQLSQKGMRTLQESKALLKERRDANIEHAQTEREERHLFRRRQPDQCRFGHIEELATLLMWYVPLNNERYGCSNMLTLDKVMGMNKRTDREMSR